MAKLVIFDDEVRSKILSGSDKLTRVVSKTMGPKGKNVMLGKFVGAPTVTKDGVSVAREIVLDDPFENLACQLIKEASGRTADIAGDGTTTATVLSDAILKNGYKLLKEDVSPIEIREGFGEALTIAKDFILSNHKKVTSYEEIMDIASISANNDRHIGKHIADAYSHAGLEGTVTAEANATRETHVRFVEGVEIKSGVKDTRFLPQGAKSVRLSNAFILCLDREVSHFDDCIHILNALHEKNAPFVVFAKDITKSALETLIANNNLGKLSSCAVKLPQEMLEGDRFNDLCVMLGTSSEISKKDLRNLDLSDLGFAKNTEIGLRVSKVFETSKNDDIVNERISYYNHILSDVIGDNRRHETLNNIRFLKSKGAVLSVGYSTELELREKGDRIEDALWATRAALEDGIVPGGGTTLLRCASVLKKQNSQKYQKVFNALADACMQPFYKICSNANKDPKSLREVVLSKELFSFGYDAKEDEFGDLFEKGVVDPVKVTLTALSNAVSIALVLINTESIVAEDPEKPSDWQPPAGWRPPEKNTLNHRY